MQNSSYYTEAMSSFILGVKTAKGGISTGFKKETKAI